MIDASHGRVRSVDVRGAALPGVCAAGACFWLAFDNGSYGTTTWAAAAVVVWWAVALAAFDLLPARRPSTAATGIAALLALLALWSLASTGWAADRDAAYDEAARVALYAGAFLLVALTIRGRSVGACLDGIAAALVAVAVVALASRLFPGLASTGAAARALPAVVSRLSWPVGYWNGLAMLTGLAVPLLLRTATSSRSRPAGAGAVAAIVPIACAIYLASSRGGALVALVGAVAFVLLGGSALRSAAAAAAGAAGAAVAIALLASRDALVNGPFDSAAASAQGRSAALLLVLIALAAGAAWVAVDRLVRSVRPPSASARAALGAAVAVVAVAALAVSSPVDRLRAFAAPPVAPDAPGFVATHLLSGSGSGRWQFWQAAVDQWQTAPLKGQGAGSFEAFWAAHGTLPMFVRNAHSLYLGSLGGLGLVGLLLTALVWGGGCAAACAAADRREGEARPAAAAAAAVAVAFAVGAGLDWLWELPAVALVGVVALALAIAPARGDTRRLRGAGRAALVALAVVAVAFELVPLLGAKALEGSRAAAAAGRESDAATRALRAHALEPWAVAPLEQLALLAESRGSLVDAHRWIGEATLANPEDWQVRVIAARIETERGRIRAARRELAEARRLNPRSPLLARR